MSCERMVYSFFSLDPPYFISHLTKFSILDVKWEIYRRFSRLKVVLFHFITEPKGTSVSWVKLADIKVLLKPFMLFLLLFHRLSDASDRLS